MAVRNSLEVYESFFLFNFDVTRIESIFIQFIVPAFDRGLSGLLFCPMFLLLLFFAPELWHD